MRALDAWPAILRQRTARAAHPAQLSCARSNSRMCGLIARMSAKDVYGTACALGSYATDEESGAAHRSPATDVAENGRCAARRLQYAAICKAGRGGPSLAGRKDAARIVLQPRPRRSPPPRRARARARQTRAGGRGARRVANSSLFSRILSPDQICPGCVRTPRPVLVVTGSGIPDQR